MVYDCIIIGGGLAGLQASIQLGRYHRKVMIIDTHDGRSNLCQKYNNILGYPEGVSGLYLREQGYKQANAYGVSFVQEEVTTLSKTGTFTVQTSTGKKYSSHTVLLATGVKDRFPPIYGLKECLGLSIYVCPDCDGYEITDQHAVVIGSGETGAHMALSLLYWSKEITYINHEKKTLAPQLTEKLWDKKIAVLHTSVRRIEHTNGNLNSVITETEKIKVSKAFIAFGGNEVRTSLARNLDAATDENGHLIVDPKTKQTTVKGLWAAGDAVAHSELVTAAMGDGALAALWIHKTILQK